MSSEADELARRMAEEPEPGSDVDVDGDIDIDALERIGYDLGCFPPGLEPDENGLVGVGGELSVEVVIDAYGKGIFPWTGAHPIPWFSPDPRMIFEPARFVRSRSCRALLRRDRFEVRFDTAYAEVMSRCAEAERDGQDGTWITDNMHEVYRQLHALGFTHCVESYLDGELVGGLYGISLGRAFFGESMFHADPPIGTDASKVAFCALCHALAERDFSLIDCQQETEHLRSLGGYPVDRQDFLGRLRDALQHPTYRHPWCDWAPASTAPWGAADYSWPGKRKS